jgi:hypothetical protein
MLELLMKSHPIPFLKDIPKSWGSVLPIALVVTTMLLGGCVTDDNMFSDFGKNNLSWFNSPERNKSENVVIPRDSNVLANGTETEVSIHNAIELSRQKRFIEARHILADVRALQDPEGDGYRAVSCAMAILALREGNIKSFQRLARQLDSSLGKPVRVSPSYVEVISLYRAINNQSLPVNAPAKFRQFKEGFFPTMSAST